MEREGREGEGDPVHLIIASIGRNTRWKKIIPMFGLGQEKNKSNQMIVGLVRKILIKAG
jgi:hypothetical protein